MLLIHLSDIHFHKGQVNSPFDPDQLLRSELIRDAEKFCKSLGEAASVILISGDIAFSGQKSEYDFSKGWLDELAAATGTTLAAVFTCPGNHDVDRGISRSSTIKLIRNMIKGTPHLFRNNALAAQHKEEGNNELLFKPIGQYNLFAMQFFCELTPPDNTIAKRTIELNDGSLLNLWGINSTLVSGEEDAEKELVPDPSYYQIVRKAGEEHLTICHHPPSWMKESGQDFKDHLDATVRIQLFGHLHDQRVHRDRQYMHVFAGAVQPERDAPGWKPGYNVIQLKVEGHGDNRVLDIRLHARAWESHAGQFVCKPDRDSNIHSHQIKLESWWPAPAIAPSESAVPVPAEVAVANANPSAPKPIDPLDSVRNIGIRFFRLTLSQRAGIAGTLGLFGDDDGNKTDVERYRDVFKRVIDRDLIEQLDSEIAKLEK